MSTTEIVFYIIPCILQIFAFYLDWKRIHMPSSILGMAAFIFIVIGLVCLVGAFGLGELNFHTNFFILARVFLASGSLIWISSLLSWFFHRITIVGEQPDEEK